MVRTCQAEQAVKDQIEDLVQQRTVVQVGVLVGKLGQGARDFIFFLVPTPAQDGVKAVQAKAVQPVAGNKKVAQKTRAPDIELEIDAEWVAEHANQVARILPGGLSVVGLYLFAPDASFQAATPSLLQISRATQERAPGQQADSLLLHADSVTGRCAVKQCTAGALTPSALRPCDLKFAAIFAQYQQVSCRYQVDASLPVGDSKASLQAHSSQLLATEERRIQVAIGTINSTPASTSQSLAEAMEGQPVPESQSIELLCPPRCTLDTAAGTSESCSGRVRVQGSIQGWAYASKRDTAASAVELLKEDLQNSLQARLDVALEDADEGDRAAGDFEAAPLLAKPSASGAAWPLPARCLCMTKPGVVVCDYLVGAETEADATTRIKEVLGMEVASVCGREQPSSATLPDDDEVWDPMKVPPPVEVVEEEAAKQSSIFECAGIAFALAFAAAVAGAAVYFTSVIENADPGMILTATQ